MTAIDGMSTYHDAVEALPSTGAEPSVPQKVAHDTHEVMQRRKRHRAATILHDDDGQWRVHDGLTQQGQDHQTKHKVNGSTHSTARETINAKTDKTLRKHEARRRRHREAAVDGQADDGAHSTQILTRAYLCESAKDLTDGADRVDGVFASEVSQDVVAERQRILSLEREVDRLRRELALSQQASSRSDHVRTAFGSTTMEQSQATPVPIAPPPPPMTAHRLPTGAQPSPIALLAAKKANLNRTQSEKKAPKTGIALAADMGKFLAEMKNTKLRKVGLPVEGSTRKSISVDREEEGLKSILETVLRKRFTGQSATYNKSHSSSAIRRRSSESNMSLSTSNSSLTSFSSYRPPDWNDLVDNAPMPPVRLSTVEAGARLGDLFTCDVEESLQFAVDGKAGVLAQSRIPRPHTVTAPLGINDAVRRPIMRTTQVFGHALTSDEPASLTSRQPVSAMSKLQATHRTSLYLPASRLPSANLGDRKLSKQSSLGDNSMRTKGSSFDVEAYTQMVPCDGTDELEEETRRSHERPPSLGGNMDVPAQPISPLRKQDSVRSSMHVDSGDESTVFPSSRFMSFANSSGQTSTTNNRSPRPKPLPPLGASYIRQRRPAATLAEVAKTNVADMLGRPISPSKSRLRASRVYIQPENTSMLGRKDDLEDLEISDAQADVLLAEVENGMLVGMGQRQ